MGRSARPAPQPEIIDLDLPPCLEHWEDGSIHIEGHRVSVHDVLDALYAGHSIEEINDLYPTISASKLTQVVDFYSLHPGTLREFHQEQQRKAEVRRTAHPPVGPTRAELQKRLERK
jgi:uncharacterized protein (DUF433 family)